MKRFVTFLALVITVLQLHGQSSLLAQKWMYNIPVELSSDKVRQYLITDKRFSEYKDNDSSNNFMLPGASYWGRIVLPVLPNQIQTDSSNIELTFGLGTVSVYNSKPKCYTGQYKILRFVYYIKDSIEIDRLFEIAKADFTLGARHIDFTEYTTSTYNGSGITITYINNKRRKKKIELCKTTYLNGTRGIMFSYEISGL